MLLKVKRQPTIAPLIDPVTLSEVKAHLNINHDADNELLSNLIKVAVESCQNLTNLSFISQTWTGYNKYLTTILEIPRAPTISISTVKYYDSDNELQTISSDNYFLSFDGAFSNIVFVTDYTLPTLYNRPDAVQIEFVAGFGVAADDVPMPIKQAILLTIGHFYAHRESVSIDKMDIVPETVQMLLFQYKTPEVY